MKKLNKYIILLFLFFISILFFIIHIQKDKNNKNELKYVRTKIDEFNEAENLKEYGEIKYDYFNISYELIKINNKFKMDFAVNNTDISEVFTIYKIENVYYLYVESEDKYIQLPDVFGKESKSIYDLIKILIDEVDNIKIVRKVDLVNVNLDKGEIKSNIIIDELEKYEQLINSFFEKNNNVMKSKLNENQMIYSIDMEVKDTELSVNVNINGFVINQNASKSVIDTVTIDIEKEKIVPLEEYLYIH